jgi:dTDP-4-dehydrorhamnose reductase
VNIIVLGARGMLGTDLVEILEGRPRPPRVTGWDIDEVDITDRAGLAAQLRGTRADVVINCAAYTAVDKAEEEREAAFRINALGARHAAACAAEIGARSVLVSTDYVFDGKKDEPWREDDRPRPINYYGHTKLMAEWFARDADPGCLIVRTQWLYGAFGRNFVETMLALSREHPTISVVDDQHGSPTYARDLALAIAILVEKKKSGVYHVSNSGRTTWCRFAQTIFRTAEQSTEVVPIPTDQYPTPARRPKNSVFDLTKLIADTGHTPRPWEEALGDYLSARKEGAAPDR